MISFETQTPDIQAFLNLADSVMDGYLINVADSVAQDKVFKATDLVLHEQGTGMQLSKASVYSGKNLLVVKKKIDDAMDRLLAAKVIAHAYTFGPGYFRLV